MKNILRPFLSQWVINTFWHLPIAFLANIIYGFPAKKLKVIGVTGTDGKTTTTNMIYQILKAAGKKVSVVSTLNAPGLHVTSPDPMIIQKFARVALDKKEEYLVLEVTSHALDQFRFWGVKFEVGVITNITHEHLDYHRTFENYFNTKLSLIKNVKYAIINQNIKQNVVNKTITFGLNKGDFNQREVELKLKIPGDYNIENALAALTVAYVLDIPREKARKTLENFEGLIGRMEFIKNNKGIKIIIDFAHTPNGLEKSLIALRSQASPGRLIAVFGCASERDTMKRSMMGKISAKFADVTIITDEDPRYEDRNKIIDEIAEGTISTGAKIGVTLFKEADRQKAIKLAISLAKKGDTIGIFGKGHEKSINYKGVETPWSDFEAVKKALNG